MQKISLTKAKGNSYATPYCELVSASEEENILTTFGIPDITEEEEDW